MPIICAWCQQSVITSKAGLVFYVDEKLENNVIPYSTNLEPYEGKEEYDGWHDRWDPDDNTQLGYQRYFQKIKNHEFLQYLSDGYYYRADHMPAYESGVAVAEASQGLCQRCLNHIIDKCKESAERAEPPCDIEGGDWVGFTSKVIFDGSSTIGPVLLCAAVAKLFCIVCEKNYSTIELITTWSDECERDDGGNWNSSHIKLGRGPMVDCIRKGEWVPWIIRYNDKWGEWEKRGEDSYCYIPDGMLTQDGWCCSNCD